MEHSDPLTWKRTGKITMRADDYLIIRYPTHYAALHGPQTARVSIGQYPDAETAKTACEQHRRKEAASG
jgi:hypothetical protein